MKKLRLEILLAIIAAGAVWGMSEVIFGGIIRHSSHHLKAGILTGMGLGIIGIFLANFRKPFAVVGIATIACLVKQLVVPILGVSFACKANSCLAVVLEASALAGAFAILKGRKNFLTGASAGMGGAVLFYFIGMRVAPCPYLLSFNHKFASWIIREGFLWMGFSAVLYPAGILVGEKIKGKINTLLLLKPSLYYRIATAIIVSCFLVSAFAISRGL
ncbi:MAG: hypothetical protein COZ15_01620 [Elusimicrobia bacterium CG_4_10_14_3_um_filter_49_12_50_7]|nr:MAG: hypothetical protein COS41_06030 [Elusimicrobia bacterium CG03_land_8_20_14_0_80_50_18]PIX16233.1 MAG: hypothetical protein COZ72_01485 [Elusimicrobia bacterium CG_4_8_14_3_um_filter_50_9]PIY17885.1 MAG: hypothetical protein COZ15_01620 [Elusimicrobia bacterium CG_4_10_14_3_um_filter_49_12_50_7]